MERRFLHLLGPTHLDQSMFSLFILICPLMVMRTTDSYTLVLISNPNVLKHPFGLRHGYQVFVGGPMLLNLSSEQNSTQYNWITNIFKSATISYEPCYCTSYVANLSTRISKATSSATSPQEGIYYKWASVKMTLKFHFLWSTLF